MFEPGNDFLMQRVADELGQRLELVERQFDQAVAAFSFTPCVAAKLQESGKCGRVSRIELPVFIKASDIETAIGSPERVPALKESANLVVSLMSMHGFNDLPGFLCQIRNVLKPDGLFVAALPAAGTLQELRESLLSAEAELTGGAHPRVFPFADVRQLGGLLQQAGFALPVADQEDIVVRYDTMFDLIRDLRAMGATNTLMQRSRSFAGRDLFKRAAEIYSDRFSDDDGRVRATISVAWLSGWVPHESQQKPARRGSADARLSDYL